MPAIVSLGGIALAVLGLLIAFAGMPDRAAGLGLGSDLIQTGATILVGGLVVAALGQVLKALRDVSDRVEEAGFGLSAPRPALNDERSETAPTPLPRAARQPAATPQDDFEPPAREPRTPQPAPRAAQPAPRTARPALEPQRPQPRAQVRPAPQPDPNFDAAPRDEDFTGEYADQHQQPRWMRAQAEANNRQQESGAIPLQSSRVSRATPVTPPSPQRRETPPATAPNPYEAEPRRRAAPQLDEAEHGEPTVVRSGIIAGMAYTLYSDRSIEAELPAGTVRFNSLSELQEHVKRAGVDDQDQDYRGQTGAQH
jgi:hypothetical protein